MNQAGTTVFAEASALQPFGTLIVLAIVAGMAAFGFRYGLFLAILAGMVAKGESLTALPPNVPWPTLLLYGSSSWVGERSWDPNPPNPSRKPNADTDHDPSPDLDRDSNRRSLGI